MTFQFSRPTSEPSSERWSSPLAGWSAYRDLEAVRIIERRYGSPATLGEVAATVTVELPDDIVAMQQPPLEVAEYLPGPEPQS